MTNSEQIEEIMYEAYNLKIHRKVFDLAKKNIDEGMLPVDAYEKALRTTKENKRREIAAR
jgi:methanogenic corrinoid protein MtbC1